LNKQLSFKSPILLEARSYLKLAVPYTVSKLSEPIITFVDTVMIGLLGSETLAAAALGVVNFYTLILASTGFLLLVWQVLAGGQPWAIGFVLWQQQGYFSSTPNLVNTTF